MRLSISEITKRRGRRPTTGTGSPVMVRLLPDLAAQIDAWTSSQPEPHPSRPEAIRRLVQRGLQPEQAGETVRAAYERLWREVIQDAQDPDLSDEVQTIDRDMLAERLSDEELEELLEDAVVRRCEETFKARMKAARQGKPRT